MCQIRPIDERQTADLRKKQQQKNNVPDFVTE